MDLKVEWDGGNGIERVQCGSDRDERDGKEKPSRRETLTRVTKGAEYYLCISFGVT